MAEVTVAEKQVPSHIRAAFDVISNMGLVDEEKIAQLRKKLPAIASRLKSAGEEVTPDRLKDYIDEDGTVRDAFAAAVQQKGKTLAGVYRAWEQKLPPVSYERHSLLPRNPDTLKQELSIDGIEYVMKSRSFVEVQQYLSGDIAAHGTPELVDWFIGQEGMQKKSLNKMLVKAVGCGRADIAEKLLDAGADISEVTYPSFWENARGIYAATTELIASHCKDRSGWMAPIFANAIAMGDMETPETLIRHGFNPQQAAQELEYLADLPRQSFTIIKFLQDNGADVSKALQYREDDYKEFLETVYVAWQKTLGILPPVGCSSSSPQGVSLSVFRAVSDVLQNMERNINQRNGDTYAYNAAVVFQSEDQVARYVEKWIPAPHDGETRSNALQGLFENMKVPATGRRDVDFKSWADAIMQCGPAMAKFLEHADKVPCPLKTDDGKSWSLRKTQREAAKYHYERGIENPELAALFLEHNLQEESFEEALEWDEKRKRKKVVGNLPKITIDGKEFGMPGAVFKRLDDGDYRAFVLGHLTDCCQHIEGNAKWCVEIGFKNPNSSFYVVAVNDDKKGEEIVGQAWAWRGRRNELVLDSIETLGKHENVRVKGEQWKELLEIFAKKLEEGAPDITALRVGTGGKTPSMGFVYADGPAQPRVHDWYDSGEQYRIWTRKKPKPAQKPTSGDKPCLTPKNR